MKTRLIILVVVMLLVGGCTPYIGNVEIMDELTNVETQIGLNHDILINRLAVCEAEMDAWKFDASNERSQALYWKDQATDMHNRFICAYHDVDYGCLTCVLSIVPSTKADEDEVVAAFQSCIEQTLPEHLWPSW